MKLTFLNIERCGFPDLTPLHGMPLEELHFDLAAAKKGMEGLRQISSLKNINRMPRAEFWRQYDAGSK